MLCKCGTFNPQPEGILRAPATPPLLIYLCLACQRLTTHNTFAEAQAVVTIYRLIERANKLAIQHLSQLPLPILSHNITPSLSDTGINTLPRAIPN